MSERPKRGFAARPSDPENWVKSANRSETKRQDFTARLTIDVTPELRGRIKIAAFERGVTVADMFRDLLTREFPDIEGDQP
ncbi:ribbon-helix-helix protein [Hoeflea alexandrii]|uniref:ribbon-helix-helix protein n=1 Tax=Hoeflea alexandrii TaxID=288436 RepID=UPI0022B03E61|nr:hypothetical protein [Hoeflea alexandrii]MCZ4288445.1 hypothetical protein [Hoeflea alexandrii]